SCSNTTDLPSGKNAGQPGVTLEPVSSATTTWFENVPVDASKPMTTSWLPRAGLKATRLPSGENAGMYGLGVVRPEVGSAVPPLGRGRRAPSPVSMRDPSGYRPGNHAPALGRTVSVA